MFQGSLLMGVHAEALSKWLIGWYQGCLQPNLVLSPGGLPAAKLKNSAHFFIEENHLFLPSIGASLCPGPLHL
jgi:hypothetical protein